MKKTGFMRTQLAAQWSISLLPSCLARWQQFHTSWLVFAVSNDMSIFHR